MSENDEAPREHSRLRRVLCVVLVACVVLAGLIAVLTVDQGPEAEMVGEVEDATGAHIDHVARLEGASPVQTTHGTTRP